MAPDGTAAKARLARTERRAGTTEVATLALLDGIPSKVVAEVLGHSSTRVTEDIYSHVTPGMKADATARVAAMLAGRTSAT